MAKDGFPFPRMEEEILKFWRKEGIFERSLKQREGGPRFVFYEGPPTANGRPGVHHVLARVFKDIYLRYRTMRGYYVPRKAGWDCHGLPVELEVEKELGLNSKREIEAYGIARFNARCRESVTRYVKDWEALSERIAFWLDYSSPYWTMDPSFVESCWWALKSIWEQGLLVEDFRVVPYCPRCGTALSDHEVAQGYATVRDPSIYVRFPLQDGDLGGASLLVWTTTPWTLVSNLGVAINPEVTYALVEYGGERLILAEPLVRKVLGEGGEVRAYLEPGELDGRKYNPPFRFFSPGPPAFQVVGAEFVSTEEGTGIVHIAPAFGAEDMAVGREMGLPLVNPVDDEGRFTTEVPPYSGMRVKDADQHIIADLAERGLLLRAETVDHTYPLCWRCSTPLIYQARPSWFIRTTARKDALLRANEEVEWHPEHIKHGRYGDWLRNNVDWAVSRDRYWGTPLPIWRCPEGHDTVVGGRKELEDLAGRNLADIDLHRPAVDEVRFPCPRCGREATRLPQVLDAWFDSGSMPFGQFGYPHRGEEEFRENFPADYICEGIDQTRGWFYSLMAVSTLLFGLSSYRRVVCLGHIVDRQGRKMSKSLGNVVDPWELIETYGSDTLRWYLLTAGSPWTSRRVYREALEEVAKGFLSTLWNTLVFYDLYATASPDAARAEPPPPAERPVLDRWILSRLAGLVAEVTTLTDAFDATAAGRKIEEFVVKDLSNWYVRLSRPRFTPRGKVPADPGAFSTLREVLRTVALLVAPFTPFIAEALWARVGRGEGKDSVHLADWPSPREELRDLGLERGMEEAVEVVSLGRAARASARIKVRQPLSRAWVLGPPERLSALAGLEELVAAELNVKTLVLGGDDLPSEGISSSGEAGLTVALDTRVTPELESEGLARDLVRTAQEVRRKARLAVTDRVILGLEAPEAIRSALQPHLDYVAAECLAEEVKFGAPEEDPLAEGGLQHKLGRIRVWVARPA